MAYKGLPESLVAQVSPLDARNYARATGWQRIQPMPGQIAVYRRPGSETEEIIIPQDRSFVDYTTRMAEVIATLAEFESRSGMEVLNDILTPQSDVLRFRLVDQSTQNGTVPLELGLNLLQGSKKALLASACNVIAPRAFYPRLRRSEATAFIEACRLGQTERGSFVTTLICPLTALPGDELPDQDQTNPPLPPFARRVTTTLMKSLGQITHFIDQDTPDRILHPAADDVVISANLCEALVEMKPSGERSSLQVACSWGFTELAPQPPVETVQIAWDVFPLIEEFARGLRPADQPRQDRFVGRVDTLSGQPNQDGHMSGRVTLIFLYDDETLRAQVDLTEQDYLTACDAHRDARYVSLMGVLHRGARSHTIQDYRDFTAL